MRLKRVLAKILDEGIHLHNYRTISAKTGAFDCAICPREERFCTQLLPRGMVLPAQSCVLGGWLPVIITSYGPKMYSTRRYKD